MFEYVLKITLHLCLLSFIFQPLSIFHPYTTFQTQTTSYLTFVTDSLLSSVSNSVFLNLENKARLIPKCWPNSLHMRLLWKYLPSSLPVHAPRQSNRQTVETKVQRKWTERVNEEYCSGIERGKHTNRDHTAIMRVTEHHREVTRPSASLPACKMTCHHNRK